MKILKFLLLVFLASVASGYAEELEKKVDDTGRVTWVNVGSTSQDNEKKDSAASQKLAEATEQDIFSRYPEFISDSKLHKIFQQKKEDFLRQGKSLVKALKAAEEYMLSNGLYKKRPPAVIGQKNGDTGPVKDAARERNNRKIAKEHDKLHRKYKDRLDECDKIKKNYLDREECKDKAEESYKQSIRNLDARVTY
jgi:hypothetical protein